MDLKLFFPHSNDPLKLMRYRYKYTSADKEYYIYAFFTKCLDGISRVSWSIYKEGSDDIRQENIVSLDSIFQNMIDAEE